MAVLVEPVDVVAEIWKTLQDYIPLREREAAAEHMFDCVQRLGLDDEDLETLAESDDYLSSILDQRFEDEKLYDESEDDDERELR